MQTVSKTKTVPKNVIVNDDIKNLLNLSYTLNDLYDYIDTQLTLNITKQDDEIILSKEIIKVIYKNALAQIYCVNPNKKKEEFNIGITIFKTSNINKICPSIKINFMNDVVAGTRDHSINHLIQVFTSCINTLRTYSIDPKVNLFLERASIIHDSSFATQLVKLLSDYDLFNYLFKQKRLKIRYEVSNLSSNEITIEDFYEYDSEVIGALTKVYTRFIKTKKQSITINTSSLEELYNFLNEKYNFTIKTVELYFNLTKGKEIPYGNSFVEFMLSSFIDSNNGKFSIVDIGSRTLLIETLE